jgi:hypothetical protein
MELATPLFAPGASVSPAFAQFFGPPSPYYYQRRRYRQPPPDPGYNPFAPFYSPGPRYQYERPTRRTPPPTDYSRAPAPEERKTTPTTTIVVMGDSMADWLAYGLEDAFAEKPEFGVVRKHRSGSGLIRYEPRRDTEWTQVARDIIKTEKQNFIVMMMGLNDRQSIREKAPPRPPAPQTAQTPPGAAATTKPPTAPEPQKPVDLGPFEFRTEKWEAAYLKRIDAMLAVLKSAKVPVFWVGLPAVRGAKSMADAAYLNDLVRQRVERAGAVFVDVWDGFVDEAGNFVWQGPDYEGQIRRLRTGDGIHFTKAGARKLAHYVEREIQRNISNRSVPVALPIPEATQPATPGKPRGPAPRPLAGPVVPLTGSASRSDDLLGARPTPAATDPVATRVLNRGEPVAAPSGRADDFSWPRGGTGRTDAALPATTEPEQTDQTAARRTNPRP